MSFQKRKNNTRANRNRANSAPPARPQTTARPGSRRAKQERAAIIPSVENCLYKWMDHRGGYPNHGHPAPGTSSARCSDVVVDYRFMLNASAITPSVGFSFSPGALSARIGSTRINSINPAGFYTQFPVFTYSAVNATTTMSVAGIVGHGGLAETDVGHTQFLGAEASIHGTSTTLNAGGDGIVIDGSGCSSILAATFSTASPGAAPIADTYTNYKFSTMNGGEFLPKQAEQMYRWHPHGSHVDQWQELGTQTGVPGIANNAESLGEVYLDETTSASPYLGEKGHTMGLFISSAEAATQYSVHLRMRYRFRPTNTVRAGYVDDGTTRPSTYVAQANPQRSARLSAVAGELAQNARSSGVAKMTTKTPQSAPSSSLLKTYEAATIGGAGAATGIAAKGAVTSAGSSLWNKLGSAFATGAEDVAEVGAVLV